MEEEEQEEESNRRIEEQRVQRQETQSHVRTQQQQASHDIYELEQQLEGLRGQCPVCFVRKLPSQHTIHQCPQEISKSVYNAWLEMKKMIRKKQLFAPYSCCFDCYVPQSICQKWVRNEKKAGKWERVGEVGCQFEDIIGLVFVTARTIEHEILMQMEERWDGVDIQSDEQVYRWVGQKIQWGGREASRLSQVFHKFVRDMG